MSSDTEHKPLLPPVKPLENAQPPESESTADRADNGASKPRFTRGQIITASIASISVAAAGFFGGKLADNGGPDEPAPAQPVAEAPAYIAQETVEFPAGAEADFFQSLTTEYSYVDPIATYYSEEDYKNDNDGRGSVLDSVYVKTLELPTAQSGEVSDLDFHAIKLPIDSEINNQTMIDFFNNSVAHNLERYLNLIAKNPDPAVANFIKNDFTNYCGEDNPGAAQLMSTLDSIAGMYGSAANYTVAPASSDENNTNVTFIDGRFQPTIDGVDENGDTTAFSSPLNLVVIIETMDNEGNPTMTQTVVEGLELSVTKPPVTGPVDIGYRALGQQTNY